MRWWRPVSLLREVYHLSEVLPAVYDRFRDRYEQALREVESARANDLRNFRLTTERLKEERASAQARAIQAQARAIQAEAERDRAEVERDKALGEARSARLYLEQVIETPSETGCVKIKYPTVEVALTQARRIEADTGCGRLTTYKCPVCPRQPVTLARWVHLTHVDASLRGEAKVSPPRSAQIRSRVDPAQITMLHHRFHPDLDSP